MNVKKSIFVILNVLLFLNVSKAQSHDFYFGVNPYKYRSFGEFNLDMNIKSPVVSILEPIFLVLLVKMEKYCIVLFQARINW